MQSMELRRLGPGEIIFPQLTPRNSQPVLF